MPVTVLTGRVVILRLSAVELGRTGSGAGNARGLNREADDMMAGAAGKWVTLLCGAGCALCVLLYTQGVSARAEAAQAEALERFGGEQVSVCVAKADMAAGQTVTNADVELRPWASSLLADDPVRDVSDAVGRRLTSAVYAGEVVSERRFLGDEGGLAVPEGMVAVSVPAQNVQVVGGAVQPGDAIDVYATGSSATALLGSSVPVLATSADGFEGGDELTWVTLAFAPDRVQEVVAAAQTMQLYFALPGQGGGGVGSQTPDLSGSSEVGGRADSAEGVARSADPDAQTISEGLPMVDSAESGGR
ncbi:Flp pilus assembly protein CpaB [Adlercreutzia aquisgranensis]|uniref:Flp pilus assembly protein CpaB n=1 Tax=Adlercreutzia aquisgranensis TaxID=2941323 RepID=UPI00204082C8|nr:Flp pilus assembly protein CpaB [Adlercreutzia aquisgranensis]